MSIIIKEVLKENELNEFIRFPERLYKGIGNYIPPVRSEEEKTFAVDINPAFVEQTIKKLVKKLPVELEKTVKEVNVEIGNEILEFVIKNRFSL